MEEHHRALSAAAQTLAQTQQDIDRGVESRRALLDRLFRTVSERSDDLGAVIQSCVNAIDQTFVTAEDRARELGQYLTESAQASTATAIGHFEAVRARADEQREVTAETLNSVYDNAVTQIDDVFRQTLDRFRHSAGEVRDMAAGLQTELSAARDDLRRSTVEIPRETAEQAREVRRVLDEQIKTLAALTTVAGRVGNGLDIAEPARAINERVDAFAPPGAARPSLPAPTAAAERVTARDSAAAGPAPASSPPRPRTSVKIASPAAPVERGDNWLTDLLARASEDEPQSSASTGLDTPVPNSAATPYRDAAPDAPLPALNFDVTNLIDNKQLVDAWDLFRRGERNVFSRRIYTASGQQTFEEIRRRFRADPEFRETVNQYAVDFEKVLRDAAATDQDGSLIRRYVTSDAGKVYTILAHAAGRLD